MRIFGLSRVIVSPKSHCLRLLKLPLRTIHSKGIDSYMVVDAKLREDESKYFVPKREVDKTAAKDGSVEDCDQNNERVNTITWFRQQEDKEFFSGETSKEEKISEIITPTNHVDSRRLMKNALIAGNAIKGFMIYSLLVQKKHATAEISQELMSLVIMFLEDTNHTRPTKSAMLISLARSYDTKSYFLDDLEVRRLLRRILELSLEEALFMDWKAKDTSLRHLLYAYMDFFSREEAEAAIMRVLHQVGHRNMEEAYNFVLLCLNYRFTRSEFSMLPKKLLEDMESQGLVPNSESLFTVLKSLLKMALPGLPRDEEYLKSVIKIYRQARERGQELPGNFNVSFLKMLVKYTHPSSPYGVVVFEVASDIVDQVSIFNKVVVETILAAALRLTDTHRNEVPNPKTHPHMKWNGNAISTVFKRLIERGFDAKICLKVLLPCFAMHALRPKDVPFVARRIIKESQVDLGFGLAKVAGVYKFLDYPPPVENMLVEFQEAGINPDVQFMNEILTYYAINYSDANLFQWYENLTSPMFLHPLGSVKPNLLSHALLFDSLCRLGRKKELLQSLELIFKLSSNQALRSNEYMHILSGLGAIISNSSPTSKPGPGITANWAILQIQLLLNHMEKTNYIGPKNYIYSKVIKVHAEYVRGYSPKHPIYNAYLDLITKFKSLIIDNMFNPDEVVFSFVFGAMAKAKILAPQINTLRSDMELVSNYMLVSAPRLSALTFSSQFTLFGTCCYDDLLEASYRKFLELCRGNHFEDSPAIDTAICTYLKYSKSTVNITDKFKELASIKRPPIALTFSQLIRNSTFYKLDNLKEILFQLRKHQDVLWLIENNYPPNSDIELTSQLIRDISSAFYTKSGSRAMSDAVEYVLRNNLKSSLLFTLPPAGYSSIIELALRKPDREGVSVALEWLTKLSLEPQTEKSIEIQEYLLQTISHSKFDLNLPDNASLKATFDKIAAKLLPENTCPGNAAINAG